ncbi:Pre-rRNA-processing esf2 [Micractinium conductrix]|uniref:Pre-rRNA-processing esf2 n=1 Tax=Micractinium conductrix TaxID=554055 RepID=A0A2P6V9K0_9CHLO|nr:Pre-rRNA-processing esf2 [Micractinium conductrix]|eukprot:PSC70758.1 Pre-rRNA-processing esf2 [Micractinium conductrix]
MSDVEGAQGEAQAAAPKQAPRLPGLSDKKLQRLREKDARRGVVYISRIPPHLKPQKLRQMLEQYAEIGRVYLAPEDPLLRKKRTKQGGNSGKNFTEGWMEFEDKAKAKEVVAMLNGQQMGGKRRSAYYYDLWCLKYLPKFKWDHLTEEINYQKAVREQRLAAEISAAKRERDFYLSRVDKAKGITAMVERKRKREAAGGGDAVGGGGAAGGGVPAQAPSAGEAGEGRGAKQPKQQVQRQGAGAHPAAGKQAAEGGGGGGAAAGAAPPGGKVLRMYAARPLDLQALYLELSDVALLKVAGVGCALHAAQLVAAPRTFHDLIMADGQVCNETAWRWCGLVLGTTSAQMLSISASKPPQKTVKNALKATGASFLVTSAFHAYNGDIWVQKWGVSRGVAVGQALLGALCLVRGCSDGGSSSS